VRTLAPLKVQMGASIKAECRMSLSVTAQSDVAAR
jgi:hypothetical protein